MALISFTHNFSDIPADAVNVQHKLDDHRYYGSFEDVPGAHYGRDKIGPQILTTWHTHVGLCLKDFERNGYNDSDFYMVVWNEEKAEPETICFASTRGWSYPAYGSFVDATDEVKAKYAAWEKARNAKIIAERRHSKAVKLAAMRCAVRNVAKVEGFAAYKLMKLRKVYGAQFEALVNLMTNTRIRSGFKLKLRAQVVAWLKDDAPKYATPLSRKQMEYV